MLKAAPGLRPVAIFDVKRRSKLTPTGVQN